MSSSPQYEFDEKQNNVIEQLSNAMRWVASAFQVIGVLYGVALAVTIVEAVREPRRAFGIIYAILGLLFFLALGIWTSRSARSFHRVVKTTGNDITNLMDALDNLRKLYSLVSLGVKIYVVLFLLSLIAMIIVLIFAAGSWWQS